MACDQELANVGQTVFGTPEYNAAREALAACEEAEFFAGVTSGGSVGTPVVVPEVSAPAEGTYETGGSDPGRGRSAPRTPVTYGEAGPIGGAPGTTRPQQAPGGELIGGGYYPIGANNEIGGPRTTPGTTGSGGARGGQQLGVGYPVDPTTISSPAGFLNAPGNPMMAPFDANWMVDQYGLDNWLQGTTPATQTDILGGGYSPRDIFNLYGNIAEDPIRDPGNMMPDYINNAPDVISLLTGGGAETRLDQAAMYDEYLKMLTTPGQHINAQAVYDQFFGPEGNEFLGIPAAGASSAYKVSAGNEVTELTPQQQKQAVVDAISLMSLWMGEPAVIQIMRQIDSEYAKWLAQGPGPGAMTFMDWLRSAEAGEWY